MTNQETALTTTTIEETLPITALAHILSTELQLNSGQIARTIALLDEGNTIPFIARYRKEVTGSLDEVQIQTIADRAGALRALHERKADVRRLIGVQGKLTPELAASILAASTLQEVEDLYLPYRPKRKTRASVAREKGLAPLAEIILQQPERRGEINAILEEYAHPFLDAGKGVETSLEAYAGARDIAAEIIAEDAGVRGSMRTLFFKYSTIAARVADPEKIVEKDPSGVYQLYYDFNESVTKLVPHRVLALNRAEHEEVLRVSVSLPYEQAQAGITQHYSIKTASPFSGQLAEAMEDGYKRLLAPAMEREVRVELTRQAEAHAINIFAANLRNLLLQPPLRGRKVLGIDPGFRTGCKLAVIDETSKYIDSDTIYLHKPEQAQQMLRKLLAQYHIDVISIGNGTASRETEQLVAGLIRELEQETGQHVGYVIVNEAGASVYSASEAGRQEFPTLDATQRGTISIARRLQDPLAELVKIDPKAVGVGLYQHDVDQKELAAMLERVVASCVNFAGVEESTALSNRVQTCSRCPALAPPPLCRPPASSKSPMALSLWITPSFTPKATPLHARCSRCFLIAVMLRSKQQNPPNVSPTSANSSSCKAALGAARVPVAKKPPGQISLRKSALGGQRSTTFWRTWKSPALTLAMRCPLLSCATMC